MDRSRAIRPMEGAATFQKDFSASLPPLKCQTYTYIYIYMVRADLGSHKPVRVGKRRPESTASIRSSNNPVTVIDYANSNHNPNHNPNHNYQCERCRLCSSLTTANGFMRTHIVSHRRGRVGVGMRTGCRNTPRTCDRRGCL